MKLLARGLARGIAFGLAASTVEIGLNLVGFIQRRFGPGPVFFAKTAALEIALGALLGLAAAPLLRLRGGRWVHLARAGRSPGAGSSAGSLSTRRVFASAARLARAARRRCCSPLPRDAGSRGRRPRLAWALGAVLLLAAHRWRRASTCALRRPPLPPRGALPPPTPGAPDVVLVVLDTVRAGNVSSYGYGRPTSPELDAPRARRRALPRRHLALDVVAAVARLALHGPLPVEPRRARRAPLPRRALPDARAGARARAATRPSASPRTRGSATASA